MVAAVPEGLPALATLAQVAAARRLAGNNALVRNPRALEALGRVDQICFDKTGTLTQNSISMVLVSDGSRRTATRRADDVRPVRPRCGDPGDSGGQRQRRASPCHRPGHHRRCRPGSRRRHRRRRRLEADRRDPVRIPPGLPRRHRQRSWWQADDLGQGSARGRAAAVRSAGAGWLGHATRQAGARGPARRGRSAAVDEGCGCSRSPKSIVAATTELDPDSLAGAISN